MFPRPRRGFDARGDEVTDAAVSGQHAAQGRLVDADESGEVALIEAQVTFPPAQPGDVCPTAATKHDNVISVSETAVKRERATIAPVTAGTERASQRFILLIRELAAEEGEPEHGWKTRVAKRLGVSPSYVSLLARDVRVSVGAESIDKACSKLRLHRDYFYGARRPVSYRDYMTTGRDPAYRGWREFRENPIGSAITEDERTALTSIVLPEGKEPTVAFYEGMLSMVQNRLTMAEALAAIEMAEEIDRDLAKKRRPKG